MDVNRHRVHNPITNGKGLLYILIATCRSYDITATCRDCSLGLNQQSEGHITNNHYWWPMLMVATQSRGDDRPIVDYKGDFLTMINLVWAINHLCKQCSQYWSWLGCNPCTSDGSHLLLPSLQCPGIGIRPTLDGTATTPMSRTPRKSRLQNSSLWR